MAEITDVKRLNYYEGEYLGAVDFEAEQEYHRDMRRRHNLGPHTWGIVTGLDITQFLNGGPNSEVDVFVQPGVAVDGYGREIIVFGPYQLSAELFADFPGKQTLSVWIGYEQQMINPSSDTCRTAGQSNAFSRVQESFEIVVKPIPPTNNPVYVDGREATPPATTGWTQPSTLPPLPTTEGAVVIALDESVPFQDLPDDNTTARWLVQLGQVLWDGPNQRFLQSADANANAHRQYAGSVASVIYAPAGALTFQDRSTPASAFGTGTNPTGVAVEVQGTLTVDNQLTAQQDVWLNGGNTYALRFKDNGGSDGDTSLNIQRLDGAAGGAALHVHIGDGSDPKNTPQQLTVGYGKAAPTSDTTVFSVGSDGNAQIPAGSLSFGAQQSQMLNLSGSAYGIGVQPGTLFFRSASDFAFYDNGTYSAKQDDPGGGSLLMLLDSRGDLTISGALVIDLANENPGKMNPGLTFGLTSGEGISSQRTAGGNQYGLDFYTGFSQRMSITNGGNVGIGTNTPDAQLNLGGGAWNLAATEGDLKIGSDTYRLKMGVALGGGGAGDARIRAQGGTNRLMLGSGTSDVLTVSGANVGIGTITPGAMLEVAGDIKASGNFNISGKATCSGDIEVDGNASVLGGLLVDGNQTIQGSLLVKGNLQVWGPKAGYVVDHFYCRAKKPLSRGDVVVLHTKPSIVYYGSDDRIPIVEVTLAGKAGDTRVCGIVDEPTLDASATPGLDRKSMGSGTIGSMVTLGAFAFCKVTADAGPIHAGDLLVTSETQGHAQKMAAEGDGPAGSIIGKALGSLDEGRGMIPILISHQ
jgi:hypothetical protein